MDNLKVTVMNGKTIIGKDLPVMHSNSQVRLICPNATFIKDGIDVSNIVFAIGNKYGYYDSNNNLNDIQGQVSEDLAKDIRIFENSSPEILPPPVYANLNSQGFPQNTSASAFPIYNATYNKAQQVGQFYSS